MAITFQQVIPPFSAGSGNASPAFTPISGSDELAMFIWDGSTGNSPTVTGTGTGAWVTLSSNASQVQQSTAYNLGPIGAASQTITVSDAGGSFPNCYPTEYSGVGTVTNGVGIYRPTPGAGAGLILGTSISVPTGSTLIALCVNYGDSTAITTSNGNSRGTGTLGGNYYIYADYAGAGSAIQPAFTCTAGGTDNFHVIQMMLNPPAGNNATIAWWT